MSESQKCADCGEPVKVQHNMEHVWPGQSVPLFEQGFLLYCPNGCDIASPWEILDGRVICRHDHEPLSASMF